MANLTSLLYPISAAVTALPPISAAITRAPTIEQKLDSVVSNTNNVNNIYSNSLWLTPGFNMTTTGNSPVANYVNSATFEGSLFKITGYNGSSTDDYLIFFLVLQVILIVHILEHKSKPNRVLSLNFPGE
jgi:hypothetical protein